MDCTPPPAPLVQAVREATKLASHRVAPLAVPVTCLGDIDNAGEALPGRVTFPAAKAQLYAQHPRTWDSYTVSVVLHEVLHQYGVGEYQVANASQRQLEEGVVSTVTRDLLPEYQHNLGIYRQRRSWLRTAPVSIIHPAYRPYAARVYQHGYTGHRGKAFRAKVINAAYSVRDVMVSDKEAR